MKRNQFSVSAMSANAKLVNNLEDVIEYFSVKPEDRKMHIRDHLSAVRIKNSDVNAMTIVKDGTWWVKYS